MGKESQSFTSLAKNVWAKLPLHPFLFSLLPLVIILAQNGGEINPGQSLRAGLLSISLVGLLLLLFFFFQKDWYQASISATLTITFLHASGRLISGNVLEPLKTIMLAIRGDILLISLAALIGITLLALARIRRFLEPANMLLNVAAISLFLTFLGTTVLTEWKIHQPRELDASLPPAVMTDPTPLPNIYYIVLDGYGRADVLNELYAAEDQQLLEYLKKNDFHVIEDARSNYMQTNLSLASSLNLNYLQTELSTDQINSNDRLFLLNLIRRNRVQTLLKLKGYETVTIASGYRPSELLPSSVHHSPNSLESNLLERLVIENSALLALGNFPFTPASLQHPGYPLHRQRVEFSLTKLAELSTESRGPRFVFTHLLVPHPPFVFDKTGEARQPDYPYVLLDGDAFPGDPARYRVQYEAQRHYLDRRLVQTLERILSGSGDKDVIIIQGDHGPGSELDWSSASGTNLRERFGILMAYRIPDTLKLYAGRPKSPVNLLRSIVSGLLDVYFPPIPDSSYYSTWDRPLHFVPVDPQELTVID